MARRSRKRAKEEQSDSSSHAFVAIRTLIATRLNSPPCIKTVEANGLHPDLALRYLDLAMVVAARQLLREFGDAVVLPIEYAPTLPIVGYPPQFAECRITAELQAVYREEPTAATLLGPLASDYVAISRELKKVPGATLGLPPPVVGDGSQMGFARIAFGDNAVLKLGSTWPKLA